MKLNTLLLASAATLIASSAFAADLPSKKAAPAAGAVQVCKIGGMSGMALPGSDTCFGLSGWVRANFNYDLNSESEDGDLDWAGWGGSYRVQADYRSNTEIGVVRGVGRLTDGNMDKAYIQFAGFTAGTKDSIADVLGTQSDAFSLATQQKEGIDYQIKAGGLNIGIALEAPNDNNDDESDTGDNPDMIAHLSGSVGSVNFAMAAASHETRDESDVHTRGTAFLGNINTTVNGLRIGVFGATAHNAAAFTGGALLLSNDPNDNSDSTGVFDYDDGYDLDTHMYGVSAMYTMGKLTVGAEYAQYEASGGNVGDDGDITHIDTDSVAVFAGYQVAKGLTLYTEYYSINQDWEDSNDDTGSEDAQTMLFRIQRDF